MTQETQRTFTIYQYLIADNATGDKYLMTGNTKEIARGELKSQLMAIDLVAWQDDDCTIFEATMETTDEILTDDIDVLNRKLFDITITEFITAIILPIDSSTPDTPPAGVTGSGARLQNRNTEQFENADEYHNGVLYASPVTYHGKEILNWHIYDKSAKDKNDYCVERNIRTRAHAVAQVDMLAEMIAANAALPASGISTVKRRFIVGEDRERPGKFTVIDTNPKGSIYIGLGSFEIAQSYADSKEQEQIEIDAEIAEYHARLNAAAAAELPLAGTGERYVVKVRRGFYYVWDTENNVSVIFHMRLKEDAEREANRLNAGDTVAGSGNGGVRYIPKRHETSKFRYCVWDTETETAIQIEGERFIWATLPRVKRECQRLNGVTI